MILCPGCTRSRAAALASISAIQPRRSCHLARHVGRSASYVTHTCNCTPHHTPRHNHGHDHKHAHQQRTVGTGDLLQSRRDGVTCHHMSHRAMSGSAPSYQFAGQLDVDCSGSCLHCKRKHTRRLRTKEQHPDAWRGETHWWEVWGLARSLSCEGCLPPGSCVDTKMYGGAQAASHACSKPHLARFFCNDLFPLVLLLLEDFPSLEVG